jgi:predicted lipid-binding transport protein (Tim44 family)
MKPFLILALSLGIACAGLAPSTADAKRIGGGGSAGMQRSLPARSTPPTAVPAQPAAPAQATPTAPATAGATAAAAAAPKRSWLGPIAGIAAGLGIAALMSHMGLGAEFGNIVMLALLAIVAFIAIRFVMARMRPASARGSMATPNGMRFDNNTSPGPSGSPWSATPTLASTATLTPSNTLAAPLAIPSGFDAAGFERIAKMIFIRMQAANDSADLNDLRTFTTPEMFAAIKLDLQDRGASGQTTDVVQLDAQVLDVATEGDRQVVSVRFHGLIREQRDAAAAPFDEVWHLVKPTDGSREWAIAGIQQMQMS